MKNSTSSIVFVDANVANSQNLIDSVGSDTEVVILESHKPTLKGTPSDNGMASQRNGIEQITKVLGNYNDLDNIQILSHGNSGSLQLGNTGLDNGNIASYKNQLQQWGEALGEDGDILLYGCNVAQGEQGAFINRLSQITAADVAASDDLTGNSDLGGDWILEATTGLIEAPLAFQVEAMSAFNSVLQTFVVDNSNDSGAGSLRQAILDAETNNNGGTRDIIQVDEGFDY